jgi:Protein of unknown function (DUF2934)
MPAKKSPSKRTSKSVKASEAARSVGINDNSVLSNEDVERRAYTLWEQRGRPLGSPEEDWYKAKDELQPGI